MKISQLLSLYNTYIVWEGRAMKYCDKSNAHGRQRCWGGGVEGHPGQVLERILLRRSSRDWEGKVKTYITGFPAQY